MSDFDWTYRKEFESFVLSIEDVDETLLNKNKDGFYTDPGVNFGYACYHAARRAREK